MKIYAITKGCYSDYHICALTVDREKAEQLKEIYSDRFNKAEIEEYEDNEGKELKLFWEYDNERKTLSLIEGQCDETVLLRPSTLKVIGALVEAPDEDHARKKAQDMIAQYKAEQAGL